jgi:hypothetical protein
MPFAQPDSSVFHAAVALELSPKVLKNPTAVLKTSVPLIKLKTYRATPAHDPTDFDIVSGPTGSASAQVNLVWDWVKLFNMCFLVITVQEFVRSVGAYGGSNHGLGGYAITGLVVAYMQHSPAIRGLPFLADNNLGFHFALLLKFYSFDFNFAPLGISLCDGGQLFVRENKHRDAPIMVLDPMDSDGEPVCLCSRRCAG